MIPESVVFKCTKSAEKLAKEKNEKLANSDGCVFPLLIGAVGIYGGIIYLSIEEIKENPKNTFMWFILITLVLISATVIPLYSKLFQHTNNIADYLNPKYDNAPYMEFAWDAAKQQFYYKDKQRSFWFRSYDIEKWTSIANVAGSSDVMRLSNGEQIILDDIFNSDVHSFLIENKEALELPDPQVPEALNPYVEKI